MGVEVRVSGWDVELGFGSQVDPTTCLTSSQLLQRPQVALFPIQQRVRSKGAGLPPLV